MPAPTISPPSLILNAAFNWSPEPGGISVFKPTMSPFSHKNELLHAVSLSGPSDFFGGLGFPPTGWLVAEGIVGIALLPVGEFCETIFSNNVLDTKRGGLGRRRTEKIILDINQSN